MKEAIEDLVASLRAEFEEHYEACEALEGPSELSIQYGEAYAKEVEFKAYAREEFPELVTDIIQALEI